MEKMNHSIAEKLMKIIQTAKWDTIQTKKISLKNLTIFDFKNQKVNDLLPDFEIMMPSKIPQTIKAFELYGLVWIVLNGISDR